MPEYVVEYGKAGMPPPETDGRLDAGAFHRNSAPIWSALGAFLHGRTGDVLEIGSGTGQHAVEYSRQAPAIVWWPSDLASSHLRSIAAWRAFAKLPNLQPPVRLDASQSDWRLKELGLPTSFLAMFCANVIHISPWSVAQGLLDGAGRHLRVEGRLFLYGPFRRDGVHNAPSNAAFDESLRRENPEWGVRDTADLRELGEANGLHLAEVVEMPSNNAILIFQKVL
jgi:SAM-dependent methyltransferase